MHFFAKFFHYLKKHCTFAWVGHNKNTNDNNAAFGTMRLSIKSEGVEEGKKFDATKIKGVKIIFMPGSEFKHSLEDIIFEEEKNREIK